MDSKGHKKIWGFYYYVLELEKEFVWGFGIVEHI